VRRVVYRLLLALKTPDNVEAAVREILPELATLSAKFELLTIIGYREEAGEKLVSEPVARQLEKEWRAEVRSASVDALAEEADLLRILLFASRDADPTEPPLKIADVPRITLALLKSARSEVRSQSMGSRALRRSARLSWNQVSALRADFARPSYAWRSSNLALKAILSARVVSWAVPHPRSLQRLGGYRAGDHNARA